MKLCIALLLMSDGRDVHCSVCTLMGASNAASFSQYCKLFIGGGGGWLLLSKLYLDVPAEA